MSGEIAQVDTHHVSLGLCKRTHDGGLATGNSVFVFDFSLLSCVDYSLEITSCAICQMEVNADLRYNDSNINREKEQGFNRVLLYICIFLCHNERGDRAHHIYVYMDVNQWHWSFRLLLNEIDRFFHC